MPLQLTSCLKGNQIDYQSQIYLQVQISLFLDENLQILVRRRILGRLYVLRTELRAFVFVFLSRQGAPSVDFLPKGQSNWLPDLAIFASANLTYYELCWLMAWKANKSTDRNGHISKYKICNFRTLVRRGSKSTDRGSHICKYNICYFWTKTCKFQSMCDESRLVRLRILGRLYVLRTELRAFGFVFSSKHGASSVDFLPVHETLYQSRDWLSSVNFSLLSIVGRN